MKLTEKQKNIIDIIQWVCIIILLAVSIFFYFNRNNKGLVTEAEYNQDQTYIKIYESQEIATLKKQNKELYDSIKRLENVEYAAEIRYKYKYVTDTIKVTEFIEVGDSTYHYVNDNDTIRHEMTVRAKGLDWVKDSIAINDKFMIINRELNGVNETIFNHPENMEVTNFDVWHRKEEPKWYQKFTISPQIGFGYGLINNRFDVYVGVGVGYKF